MTVLAARMLALLALAAGAWLVHVFGRVLPTWGAGLVLVGLAAPITLGLARRGRLRCAAFRAVYLRPDSAVGRRLGGSVLIHVRAALVGGLLALVLFSALVRLADEAAWAVLVVGAPAAGGVFALWRNGLRGTFTARYLPEVAWRLTVAVAGVAMGAVLVWLAFHRPYPDVGGVTLERAVWHFVDQERARSAPVELLLQLAAVKDGVRLWIAQQLMPQPGLSAGQAVGWLIVLAEEAVFVWSYLSFLCPVVIESKHDERRDVTG
ncbi:MAG TPA: hypothetical protein VF339_08470 [Gammaproteobacteria bacterium]